MAVVIYARKSTESEDRQVQSLEDQLSALRDMAANERLIVSEEFLESRSAKEPGTRPEFQRLLELIEVGTVDGVLTWQINRLARNLVDGGRIAHLLHSGKLGFIRTPDRVFHPEDSAILLAIETGVATSFIQDLRKNVRRGLEGKARRGWRPTRAPIGYVNNRLTRQIEIDPVRFTLVQRGWDMLRSGQFSIADVARELQRLGLNGTEQDKPIAVSRVYSIYRNEFYTGWFSFRGEMVEGRHEPMVSREDFSRIQRRLGSARKVHDVAGRHPFAGVFTCPSCGCSITAETKVKRYKTTGKSRSYTYYRCTGARGCRVIAVRGPDLDAAIAKFASSVGIDHKLRAWAEEHIAESLKRTDKFLSASTEGTRAKVHLLERRLGRLRALRVDEELSAEEYAIEKQFVCDELQRSRDILTRSSALEASVRASIGQKLEQLEACSSWNELATFAKRTFLRSIAVKAFLTLDKAELRIDAAMAKLITFGPEFFSSESNQSAFSKASIPVWCSFWDEVVKTEAALQQAEELPTVTISIPLERS